MAEDDKKWLNPNARPFAFNPSAGSFVPGTQAGQQPKMGGQPGMTTPGMQHGMVPPGYGGATASTYGGYGSPAPPGGYGGYGAAACGYNQMGGFGHPQWQQQQWQQQQQHILPNSGRGGGVSHGTMPQQQQHQQGGDRGGRKGGRGGGGGGSGGGVQAAPAPMTAIQKAEARAKAAAAEAEAKAKAAKEERARAKAEAKAAEEAAKAAEEAAKAAEEAAKAAEKATMVEEAQDAKAAEKMDALDLTEATADGEAMSVDADAVEADAVEAKAAVTEKQPTSVDDPTNMQQSDDIAVAGEMVATAALTEDTASVGIGEATTGDASVVGASAPNSGEVAGKKSLQRDEREHLNLVFIGHVDAGKSTFCGQILYQTDQVDVRTIEKYEKEAKEKNRDSWFLAFIMDTNEEERAKGKTVEVGRAHFESIQKRYTILDAPGHKNYVPNMIAGACQADVGVLVISARKGEFETGFERGGQTREHALLAKTLGVRLLVVVINKMDDPTVEWSQTRFEECRDKLTPFLKTCGYNTKKDVVFLPISAYTAQNIIKPVGDAAPWWHGPTFLSTLDGLPALERNFNSALRLPILSKYKDLGTIIEGKVEQGTVTVGDKLCVMPNRTPVEVMQVWLDQDEMGCIVGGENARVKLKDISDEDIQPGYVLSPRGALACAAVKRFEAQLIIVELLEHKSIFSAGYTAVLHVHAVAEECSVLRLTASIDKKSGQRSKKPPMFVKSGAVINCVIDCEQPVCIETFEASPQLGRFTLRDEGKTIGIGKCLKLMDDDEEA